jgi:hypothetical protein
LEAADFDEFLRKVREWHCAYMLCCVPFFDQQCTTALSCCRSKVCRQCADSLPCPRSPRLLWGCCDIGAPLLDHARILHHGRRRLLCLCHLRQRALCLLAAHILTGEADILHIYVCHYSANTTCIVGFRIVEQRDSARCLSHSPDLGERRVRGH